jgi:hypothetical protein
MNIRTIALDQEHYLNICQKHIPCPSGSPSTMVVVVLGLERVKVLKPSGHHWHCLGTACLKESVGYGRRPSIRRQQSLDRVCWVWLLTEEHWFPKWGRCTPYLYTLLRLGLQPWSGLHLRSRHAVIQIWIHSSHYHFPGFSHFRILNILSYFREIYFTLPCFLSLRGETKDHRQYSPLWSLDFHKSALSKTDTRGNEWKMIIEKSTSAQVPTIYRSTLFG